MRTGIIVSGVLLFIIGLIALGASAYHANFAGEVVSSLVAAIGIIVGVAGAASQPSRVKVANQVPNR